EHDRVDLRVDLLDACDVRLDQLDRAHLAVANRPGHRRRGSLQQLVHAATSAGRRSIHGWAASSCAESESRSSSPAGGPTSCTPTGKPSGEIDSGSEIAGWPVTFQTGVNGTHSPAFISIWIGGSPCFGRRPPISIGGLASVGVRSTSTPSQTAAT